MNKGPCRYGPSCWNQSCPFDHNVVVPQQPAACRYGPSCRRADCKFYHPSQNTPQYASPQYAPSHYAPQHPSPSSSQLCRYGASCFTPGCRYMHPQTQHGLSDSIDDGPEFTPEEEEFMDEILDMIEQEQQARGEGVGSDDERNIDEILDFIDQQHPGPQQNQTIFESEFLLPEEAEREFQAMVAQQQHQNDANSLLSSMNKMSIKGMSATAPAFVPRTAPS